MKFALVAVAVFAAVVTGLTASGKLSLWVAMLYFIASVITFVVYAYDKSAVRKGRQRISEKSLHGLGLAGGWPGALLAQQVFRHKTQKVSFRIVFWVIAIINGSVLVWISSPFGNSWLSKAGLAG